MVYYYWPNILSHGRTFGGGRDDPVITLINFSRNLTLFE